MKYIILVTLYGLYLYSVKGQNTINTGIKTRYPPRVNTERLTETESDRSNLYGYRNYDTSINQYNYEDATNRTYSRNFEQHVRPALSSNSLVVDATAEFINKTRATIASGICYKEVPTASLVRGYMIPAGNGSTPDFSKIQVCCDGYQRNPHVYSRCDPICIDDCPNGICTAPNTCECMPGHIRNELGNCISTCPLGCGNGYCDRYNECQCKSGYMLEPQQRKFCIPKCEPGCEQGICVAPNRCECQEGYRLSENGQCKPVCKYCNNGDCIAPGHCVCKEGYQKIADSCEPICLNNCENGYCSAPDTCSCEWGYELDRSGRMCVPKCSIPCLNGVCTSPNRCTCNPGYVLDEVQLNVCKPHCPQGCPNGVCSGPNLCICKPGFRKSGIKGRQSCVAV